MKKLFCYGLIAVICLALTACSDHAQPLPSLSAAQTTQLATARGNAPLGNPKGDVTVVEFFDYQCPYCRKMTPMLEEFVKQDPKAQVVFKEYILFGPDSEPATRAAFAAQKQGKYLAMHNALMTAEHAMSEKEILELTPLLNLNSKQLAKDMHSAEVTAQMNENNQLAQALKLDAAPAFIIIANNNPSKGLLWIGELSANKLEELANRVRQ